MPAVAIAAQMTPIFGPTQYTRMAGRPQTFTAAFKHCGTQQCQIVVTNGNTNGTNRISSGSIVLNGLEIVGPNAFNQHVAKIVKPVTLSDQNQLITKLASAPGSFVVIDVECVTSPAILSLGGEGVSVPDPTTLLSAVPIVNTGTTAAQDVQATAIALRDGTLTVPASLPFDLGTIPAGRATVLDADFYGGPFIPGGNPYPFAVTGTYAVAGATYCFTLTTDLLVPPAAPGSKPLGTVQVPSQSVTGGNFPPQLPTFDEEVNAPGWTVPTAPPVLGTPTPTGTIAVPDPGDPTVIFQVNSGLGFTSAGQGCSADANAVCAEPSGGVTGGGVIFATANWRAAYSTDGTTFHQLDPTTIFPNDAVGFCCDQIVQYAPSIDRFIWLLQGPGGYRLATASPQSIINSHGTAWTYWNFTPGQFIYDAATCTVTSFDYPDLSVGHIFLYVSWDAGPFNNCGFQVSRIPLADIQAGGAINIGFTDPSDARMAWGGHLTQQTDDEIFWAGHNNNSSLRVFSSQENSNFYSWRDVGISSWANNAPTATTPDGQDWLAKNFNGPGGNSFPKNGVIGAARNGSQLWFAWSAGTDSNFSQAHVEMVQLDRNNNFHKDQQVQIWNSDYAFAYPALAINACTGEVGMSFEYGGNGKYYENHVVGFWGDYVAYITTGSDKGTDRFGDYVTIRQATPTQANPGNLFAAFGWGVNVVPPPGMGTNTDVRYVLFGRPASSCQIIQ